jgi:hypothetical protein
LTVPLGDVGDEGHPGDELAGGDEVALAHQDLPDPPRYLGGNAALVHKSADGHGAAAIAAFQAMRRDTGLPSLVIRLSTAQATRASVFWAGRVRARRPRPMIPL